MVLNWCTTDNNTMGRRNLPQGFGTLRVRIFDEMPLLIVKACKSGSHPDDENKSSEILGSKGETRVSQRHISFWPSGFLFITKCLAILQRIQT